MAEKEALQKKAEAEAKVAESAAPSKEAAEAVSAPSGAPPAAPAAAVAPQAAEGAQGVEGSSPEAPMPQAGATGAAEDQPAKPPDVDRKKVLYIQERSEHEKQVSPVNLTHHGKVECRQQEFRCCIGKTSMG